MKSQVYLQAVGVLSALGADLDSMRASLFSSVDPCTLTITQAFSPGRSLPLGCLPATIELPSLAFAPLREQSRNNALAWGALQQILPQVEQALDRYRPDRVAVVVGTSTSGVLEGEAAARMLHEVGSFPDGYDYRIQEMGNLARFIARQLGVTGPAHVISTACSSGAKALASGARMLQAGMVDAVVAGGVDALCSFTVAGFSALESVSTLRCNPLSAHRKGINLGEAAAFFLMGCEHGPVRLSGWGESQDAHHMSAPDPSGQGAIASMRQALQRAGVAAGGVDYVNLHGTATAHNDAMESLAVNTLLGEHVPVSSTKPLTGHALAAAGALEAAIAWQVLHDNPRGMLPTHWWDGEADLSLPKVNPVSAGQTLGRAARHVMSNSFAFGGSNASLLFSAG